MRNLSQATEDIYALTRIASDIWYSMAKTSKPWAIANIVMAIAAKSLPNT